MKKTTLKLFSLLLFASAIFVSCGKDDENTETVEVEYYVEYHARYTQNGGNWETATTTISYGTPDGSESTTISRGQDFSVTVGPFKKGDRTYIYGNAPTTGYSHSARSAILVKKGDSPFVQKAESTTSLSCSYTIDF